jgi:hypothetical protein
MNGFTEKDAHCIAQHMAAYLESVRDETVADYCKPCIRCAYYTACTLGPTGLDAEESFAKLFSAAGVERPRRYRIRRPDEWDGVRKSAGDPHAKN